jgi:hypothetical protein
MRQKLLELLPDDLIALTGGGLETRAIRDRDDASALADQTLVLDRPGNVADRRALNPEHLRQELLGEREIGLP